MKKIILLCSILFIAVSCTKFEEISIEDARVKNPTFLSMTDISLSLSLKVNNPNKQAIDITDAELDIWLEDTYLGYMEIMEKVTIPGNSNDYIDIPIEVTIKNLTALTVMNGVADNLLDKFEVTGFIKLKSGALRKKHNVTKTTIINLLRSI
jgi:LEA14-like dessication related protein